MAKQRDLELILRSRVPIVVIETREETCMLDLLKAIAISRATEDYMPLFRWTVTDGLQRLDISREPQLHNTDPSGVLQHIRAVRNPAASQGRSKGIRTADSESRWIAAAGYRATGS